MCKYRFSLQDNCSYAFREMPPQSTASPHDNLMQTLIPDLSGKPRSGHRRCEACGELLAKWDEPLTGLKLKKRRYDISCTYDGVDVVSLAFKEICESHHLTGLEFRRLPDDPQFFAIQSTNKVGFDSEQRGTRFIKRCSACGTYESIVGATPVFLVEQAFVPDMGFARTDLEFGTGDGKHPQLLCGESAARVLKSARLRGLELLEI
jgi:hypothetical protein